MPLTSPVTVVVVVVGATGIGLCAVAPMYGVTVYAVIADPPSFGAVQLTVADALPAVAVTPVGAAGAVGAVGAVTVTGWVTVPVAPWLSTTVSATWYVPVVG